MNRTSCKHMKFPISYFNHVNFYHVYFNLHLAISGSTKSSTSTFDVHVIMFHLIQFSFLVFI